MPLTADNGICWRGATREPFRAVSGPLRISASSSSSFWGAPGFVKPPQREARGIEGELDFRPLRRDDPVPPAVGADLNLFEELSGEDHPVHKLSDLLHRNQGRDIDRSVERDLRFHPLRNPVFDGSDAFKRIHRCAVRDAIPEGELILHQGPVEGVEIGVDISHGVELLDRVAVFTHTGDHRRLGLRPGKPELQFDLHGFILIVHSRNLILLPSAKSFLSPFGSEVFWSAAIVRSRSYSKRTMRPRGLAPCFGPDKSISRAGVAIDRVPCRTTVHDEDPADPLHKRDVGVPAHEDIRALIAELRLQAPPGDARIDRVIHGDGAPMDDEEIVPPGEPPGRCARAGRPGSAGSDRQGAPPSTAGSSASSASSSPRRPDPVWPLRSLSGRSCR